MAEETVEPGVPAGLARQQVRATAVIGGADRRVLGAVHGDAHVIGGRLLRGRGGLGYRRRAGPEDRGEVDGPVFSRTVFAVATDPTSQPARVKGTHGAGVFVRGALSNV